MGINSANGNGVCRYIRAVYALYPLIGYKTLFDVENASNFQRDYAAIGDINAEEFYGPMLA